MTKLDFTMRVYLIDDDEMLLKAISQIYELDDIEVVAISDPKRFLKTVDRNLQGIVVTDVRMPVIDGFDLFNKIKSIDKEIPVIFITGHADVPMVLNTLREGAFDFFTKPIESEHLLASSRRAIDTRRLILENREFKKLAKLALDSSQFIGETSAIQKLRETARQVAKANVDILIEGETGTGKNVVANLIHKWSGRNTRKFIGVNCAALPAAIAEEELFGSTNTSQTKLRREQIGKIEASDKGTLYLDEIESLPMTLQGQLVPIVEERKLRVAGSQLARTLDLRIIASSTCDLTEAVQNNEFRSDLLYQLNTVKLRLPPLRDRKEDIPLLFAHFVSNAAERFNKKVPRTSTSARRRLLDYDWPGNVRELKNFADSVTLGIDTTSSKNLNKALSLPERVERFESVTIRSALESTSGDVRATVELLGIPRKTFYDKVSRHKIKLKKYRKPIKKRR